MQDTPKKIQNPPIVEALIEARFESGEAPELLVGELAGYSAWQSYSKDRLPTADIPLPVRIANTDLHYQPTFERRSLDGSRRARLGHDVMSYHVLGVYPGWESAGPEFIAVMQHLFRVVPGLVVKRLGLRYVNILSGGKHFISSVSDLEFKATVRGEAVLAPLTTSFRRDPDSEHSVQVTVATPEYVHGHPKRDFAVLVDVDVFTPQSCRIQDERHAERWIKVAHDVVKVEFFKLLPQDVIDQMKGKAP